jgi:RimJ/RimL family protein N-acetyltransferase
MISIGEHRIRPYESGDVAALVKYGNNYKVWKNLRDRFPHPYTRAHAIDWIRHTRRQQHGRDLAIATAVELIGGIGIHVQDDVHRRSAEIGYWLGESFWGRGIATRAVDAMTDHAFATLPVVRIYANVFEGNPASVRVLEKVGYEYEGRLRKSVYKDGKLIDQLVYGIVRM